MRKDTLQQLKEFQISLQKMMKVTDCVICSFFIGKSFFGGYVWWNAVGMFCGKNVTSIGYSSCCEPGVSDSRSYSNVRQEGSRITATAFGLLAGLRSCGVSYDTDLPKAGKVVEGCLHNASCRNFNCAEKAWRESMNCGASFSLLTLLVVVGC